MASKVYCVVSRDYPYTEYIADLGCGPTTTERDVCMVTANNKRQARSRGVKAFRKMKAGVIDFYDECPFTGMTTREVTDPEELADWKDGEYFFDFDKPE